MGETKYISDMVRILFRTRMTTNQVQKPNSSRETVPLKSEKNYLFYHRKKQDVDPMQTISPEPAK
jgi:hypothetical protein